MSSSLILVEKGSEDYRERNGINKAMGIEHCRRMTNSVDKQNTCEVKKREYWKYDKNVATQQTKLIANIINKCIWYFIKWYKVWKIIKGIPGRVKGEIRPLFSDMMLR